MRLLQFLEQVNLYEGAKERYMQSFVGLIPYIRRYKPKLEESIEKLVPWAIKTLKKDDKIQWYLRWMKMGVLFEIQTAITNSMKIDKLKKDDYPPEDRKMMDQATRKYNEFLDRLMSNSGLSKDYVLSNAMQMFERDFIHNLEHFMSLDIPEINNYTFSWKPPVVVIPDLRSIERKWQEKAKQVVDIDRQGVDTIIKFEDGSEWINLNQSYCDIEAQAMGHCGNSASYSEDDTILSYRTIEKTPKGEMWKPRLTFVLDISTGLLGEMKGRNNQKPDSKYHGVIIKLLKHRMIKGIKGGGYAPENNFDLKDLPHEVAAELMEEKPGLASIEYDYKKRGITKELLARMKEKFEDADVPDRMPEYNKERRSFMHRIGKDIDDFIENYGGRTANYIWDILHGDTFHDYEVHMDNVRSFWEYDLPSNIKSKVGEWLLKDHPDYVEEWKDDNDENYDPTDSDSVWKIISENHIEEIMDALRDAVEDGIRYGTENEMYESLESWTESIEVGEIYTGSLYPGMARIDDEQYLEISDFDMVELISNHMDFIYEYGVIHDSEVEDLREPRNGWDYQFDEKAAVEAATDSITDVINEKL